MAFLTLSGTLAPPGGAIGQKFFRGVKVCLMRFDLSTHTGTFARAQNLTPTPGTPAKRNFFDEKFFFDFWDFLDPRKKFS